MQSNPLLIRNVQCAVENGHPPRRIDVLIDRGTIVSVSEADSAVSALLPQIERRIDASDLIVMPGLVNAHVHSNEAFERGLYPSLPLERWLARSYPPLGGPDVPARWHYLRAMLVACDAIRSGTVALQDDFLNPGCDHAALDHVVEAWSDSGLRVSVATTLSDRAYLDGLPHARASCELSLARELDSRSSLPVAEQSAFFVEAHRRWNGSSSGRIAIMLGPRGPQRCSDSLLHDVARLSRDHGCAVHMHVLETRLQRAASLTQPGGGFIHRLAQSGLLSPSLTINHAVWVDQSDIQAIADSGAFVTHNPLSNQRLGSGTSPVRRLLAAGVRVALGSDGPATGDTACMSAVLRAASLLHRDPDSPASEWLGPHDAWQMATQAGAGSMGLEDGWGSLAPGAPADLVLLNARHRALVPHHDTVAQWALAGGADLVDSVIVRGSILMRCGRITAFNEDQLLDEAREAGERWQRQIWPLLEQSGARLDTLIEPLLDRVRREELPGTG
ncbi:MAG: amidohydrolase family protein [Betaproteobacteria bacterium]|nr:amidohydrolase family protein [Betaproteobacteria bacterium]